MEKIVSHKDYNQKTNENDIALVKLQSPLLFNECVRPVAILNRDLAPQETCTVTGWGAIRESKALNRRNILTLFCITCVMGFISNGYVWLD